MVRLTITNSIIIFCLSLTSLLAVDGQRPPNILIAISDDQSFAHTSMAGYPGVRHLPLIASLKKAFFAAMLLPPLLDVVPRARHY
jgi:hypothetical protein